MMNLKPIVYAFTLLSAMVACSPENEVLRSDSGTEPAVDSAAEMAVEAESAAQARPATQTGSATQSVSEFVAVLRPTEGNNVSGTVMFTDTGAGVTVNVSVDGLAPNSTHGFHIHEFGDCSAADASSAGGHFNPEGQPHGAPDSVQRHVGDLGNLLSNGEGSAQSSGIDLKLSFSGQNSILGKAVVVHADADDLETQPTGNAGARLACGVIEVEN